MTDEIKSRFFEVGFEVADHTTAILLIGIKTLFAGMQTRPM